MAYKRRSPQPVVEGGTNATSMTNTNGVIYFDGTKLNTTTVGAANQVLTSNGAGLAPTFQAAAGGGITTIDGDTGSTTGPVVTFDGDTNAGASVQFIVTGTTVFLDVTDLGDNVYIGQDAGSPFGAGTTSANTALGSGTLQSIDPMNNAGSNTAVGGFAGQAITIGSSNTFVGYGAGSSLDSASFNVFVGSQSGVNGGTTVASNTCVGTFSGFGLIDNSSNNVSLGQNALAMPGVGVGVTTPSYNVAIGAGALDITLGVFTDSIGSYNIAIGANAGSSLTGTEDSNIYINNLGVATESNILRIGAGTGAGNQQLNKTFIHGIFGITVGVSGIPVVVDNAGQLGTVVSSKRYKDNIVDMSDTNVMKLRPVNFTYKSDKCNKIQYGLIAEEVEEVMPNLVSYNLEGQPESVKYQDLSVLLLKEIQRLNHRLEELERKQ